MVSKQLNTIISSFVTQVIYVYIHVYLFSARP